MGCCGSHPVENLPSKSTLSDLLANKTENLKICASFDDSSCLSISHIPAISHSNNTPSSTAQFLSAFQHDLHMPSKPLKCRESHLMSWTTQLPFKQYDTHKTWELKCEECNCYFTSAAWYCNQCDYCLCETCGYVNSCKPLWLKCRKGHKLLWSPETIWDYGKDSTCIIFACDLCSEIKHEPSWNCEDCGFDICVTCGEKFGVQPCQEFLQCKQDGHRLGYVTLVLDDGQYENYGIRCEKCEKWIDPDSPFCQCEQHLVDFCLECVDKELKKMVPHPGFRCKDGKCLEIVAKEWVLQEIGDGIACDVCKSEYFDFAYMCIECFLCYCFACSKELHKKIINCHKEACKFGHQLKYKSPESGDFICAICREYFLTGYFTCPICNYKLCIKHLELTE